MKKILLNPFEDYSEKQLFLFGIGITILGTISGFVFDARFDGMLDLHFSESSGYEPLYDNLIAIGCSFAVFYILGKIINRKTRTIDILNTCLIARWPIYITTFSNCNGDMIAIGNRLLKGTSPADIDAISNYDLLFLLFNSVFMIGFLIWFFILLWNGFKVAANAQGTKHIIYFIGAVLVGEAISKLIFIVLPW